MTSGAMTTLIDRMESKGLVKRKVNPDDRRAALVAPTPKLFRTLGKVYLGVAKQIDQSTAELSEFDRNVSIKTLHVVAKAYRDAAKKT